MRHTLCAPPRSPVARGPSDGLGATGRQPYGGVGLLHDVGDNGDIGELVELPVAGPVLLGPSTPDHLSPLFEARAPLFAWDVEADELVYSVPLAQAKIKTAIGNDIHGSRVLGHSQ